MSRRARGGGAGARVLLLLGATVSFLVIAFGPDLIAGVELLGVGLALFAASFLFP